LANLISSILLTVAAVWSLILLNRLRDWRAGFVIACLAATISMLILTVGGQVVTSARGLPLGAGGMQQLAISGLAVAAVLYLHLIYQRDALTGLANRARFIHRVKQELARLDRHPDIPFAILALSLDRFHLVSDTLGRALGDRLLLTVAKRLARSVKAGDVVARAGATEFAVLLVGVNREAAESAVERIHRELADPLIIEGQEVLISVRIGVAVGSASAAEAEDLLSGAELAMNRVTGSDPNTLEVYDASYHRYVVERLKFESSLRQAVERAELVLHYQPIFVLQGGRLAGFEALLRWRHGERGILRPASFVPIAEETDLIVSMGQWVLEEACRQLRLWQGQVSGLKDAVMYVNLSGRQFKQPDLVDQIARVLTRSGLEPSCLAFEITESVMMDDAALTTTILDELHALNVGLSVDDFGTGYSSLRYLSRFPVDALKIDRTFVRGAAADAIDQKIIRSVINLARDLELNVVAEGVETKDQLAFLRSLGCGYGQGYYLGEPMSVEATTRLLASGQLVSRRIIRSATGGRDQSTATPLSLVKPTRTRPSRNASDQSA
jgi:diguanylate cyclase (GGDEF)-like protein